LLLVWAKSNCLFPAPDRPLENVATRNIFGVICDDFFSSFFFWLPEVPILFQNLRSELVYTFKWTKSIARLWRNQICEWTLKKKKKKSPYLPTNRWNGGSGAGNKHIFKGGPTGKTIDRQKLLVLTDIWACTRQAGKHYCKGPISGYHTI
jgi:hypothetical protein